MNVRDGRPSAEALLKDLGTASRLTVYLASAPGAGKTRRLLDDAVRAQESGLRVVIGWIETKGRPDLDKLLARFPRVPTRTIRVGDATFEDFDYEAAIALKPQLLLLDELAHANLEGGAHAKRWQDALALRDAGIAVSGALNIQHVERWLRRPRVSSAIPCARSCRLRFCVRPIKSSRSTFRPNNSKRV